jgi:hypothetical protein
MVLANSLRAVPREAREFCGNDMMCVSLNAQRMESAGGQPLTLIINWQTALAR